MKRKHLLFAVAALLVAGGFWISRSRIALSDSASNEPTNAFFETMSGQPNPTRMNGPRRPHAPPNPTQRFRDFTPEQRVEQARKGHGPGG